jgi:hypothetical protein
VLASTFFLINDINSMAETVALVVMSMALIRRPSNFLPLLFVSAWFSRIVVLPMFSAFYYYLFLYVITILFSSGIYKKRQVDMLTLAIMAFAVWLVLTGVGSLTGSVQQSLKLVVSVLALVFANLFKSNDHAYTHRLMIALSAFCSVVFFAFLLLRPVDYTIDTNVNWGVGYISNTSITLMKDLNPNSAAQIILYLYLFLFCDALSSKRKYLLLFALLDVYILYMLESRTCFYTMVIVSVIYPLIGLKSVFWKRTITAALVIYAIWLLYSKYILDSWNESRLVASSLLDDEGSGRFIMWGLLVGQVIPNYWFMGIGLGRENYAALGYPFDADNLYLDILCQTGIIGLALLMFIHIKLLVTTVRTNKKCHQLDQCVVWMVATLIVGLGESVFDTLLYWFILIYVTTSINSFREESHDSRGAGFAGLNGSKDSSSTQIKKTLNEIKAVT